ncbi:putative disease resistance protein At3g14460 [Helianthus annuus]|uniref:putative disease resistance protein At3g14460 n=1 Tax=Helianthus annuus TaxID=4232 RepID=UPI001652EA71|nr:putative disease resistance protein At3g14460 [Helianthus annuus]
MHGKLDRVNAKLERLVKQKDDFGFRLEDETRPRNNKNNNRRFQSSVVDPSSIVGRQAEKEALLHQLLLPADKPCDKNYSIVPIIGMGGVGKTTLARLLYGDKQVKDHFELKAWVCVSDEFDSFAISKVIFQSVAGVNKKFADLNLLQEDLVNHLRGKRFLLVLDDVWSDSYDDWKTLVGPFHACASGSKIIITARKDQLLKKLVNNPLNKQLGSLSDADALSLVARDALGVNNFDSHLSLKSYAEGIVKKCGGLPLALTTLGRLLRTKKDEVEHWKGVLESEIWTSPVEGEVIPALRLSYHDLSSPLKRLFAYCSLFPKDFLFDREELILLWMAEGFLHQPSLSLNYSTEEQQQRLGHGFFDELFSRSFFQYAPNNESLFVMHDLMNDLATSVATEFFIRLDNNESKKNIRMEMLEKYRHMSFVREKFVAYKKFEAFERAKSLRTFLATSVGEVESWRSLYLSNKILTDLLPGLPLLRVLSLSGFEISEVPESIGTLRHLRYLNLSRTRITHLPEKVGNLFNLRTLILFGCDKLTKLPKSFRKLINLWHLDVRGTSLLFQMLLRSGKLKSQQITLSKIVIGSKSGFEIAKLKDFKNLCGKVSIVGLEKVQNVIHAQDANFSEKRLSELELVWGDELYDSRNEMLEKEVLNELKPCQDELIKLKIRSYGGLEFPNWVGDPLFLNLKHVSISGCKRCTSIPPLGQLPSLKELLIEGLHGVEVVRFELFGTGQAFRSLEILRFDDMGGWKKWSGAVFPRLQKLEIKDCPNLVEVTLEALPSLNVLTLITCDSGLLRSLVEVASAVTKLIIWDISGLNDVVWGGVIEYLGAVEELSMWSCNEIRYLVKSDADATKFLVKLRTLKVDGCDKLVSLGEKEDDDNCWSNMLTSLRILGVYNCHNMERCSCPDGVEELLVFECSSVTDVSFPKGGQEKLRSLQIRECRKLLESELGGQKMNNNNRSSMPKLEDVWISDWPNLKSILNCLVCLTTLKIEDCESLESLPDNFSSLTELNLFNCPKLDGSFLRGNLTSLKKLEIKNCPKLEVSFLPDKLTSLKTLMISDCPKLDGSFLRGNLTSLKTLIIFDCQSMDASIPGWVWPPNLHSLVIANLKKPISEWGTNKFPTSLVELKLQCDDGARSCSGFSHLLPSSITSLELYGFKKLESFSVELHLTSLRSLSFEDCPNLKEVSWHPQHLPSLHHLTFGFCPKMMDLPEMLFPSLLRLEISYCPNLKERCSKRGCYWPLISHIPCIEIS